MSADELLEIINKQWADVHDIQKIGSVGINKAQEIKKMIKEPFDKKEVFLPYGLVPMEKVVEYFNININYLKKVKKNN